MNELASLYSSIAQAWRELPFGAFEKSCIKAFVSGLCYYLVFSAIERAHGTYTDNYRSRGFLHDVVYWFYYRMGLDYFLYTAALFSVLKEPLSFFDMQLLTPLPFLLQLVLFALIQDFCVYWAHRAQHHYRFLWAFHTTHHSQEQVNFFTGARFHPLDTLWMMFVAYVPWRMMGGDALIWIPMFFLQFFTIMSHHTRIMWTYGPLYKVLSSPRFHIYHHSTDPAHYNKNYSSYFSFWDYLFGTAVKDDEPRPTRFGLEDVKPAPLWSTLTEPFRLLYAFYVVGERGKVKSRDHS